MKTWKQMIKQMPLELIIWVISLFVLYNLDLTDKAANSICPIHSAGFDWCQGCGLGRSIGLLLHGEFRSSIEMHWLGIPTFLVLVYRIITLIYLYLMPSKLTK
jgi:hypothetical protein